jgi:hypothetical protein
VSKENMQHSGEALVGRIWRKNFFFLISTLQHKKKYKNFSPERAFCYLKELSLANISPTDGERRR